MQESVQEGVPGTGGVQDYVQGVRVQEEVYKKGCAVFKIRSRVCSKFIFITLMRTVSIKVKQKLFEGRMLGVFERLMQIFGSQTCMYCTL